MNLSSILVLIGCLLLAMSASANWTFDFESGTPPEIKLDGATVTDDPALVISGEASVIADFRTSNIEWNEFLFTNPSVEFKSGRIYHVSFHYNIIDPGEDRTRFYSLLRSSTGDDIYGRFWLWNREEGASGRIDRLFFPETDDYQLIIGVRHQGAILIDDVQINDVTDFPIDTSLRVKAGETNLSAVKSEFDEIRRADGLSELVQDFAIILCDEGAGGKAHQNRDKIVADIYPDFVDWSPIGPLAKQYGIRSSRGGPEYQEYYKFEGPGIWDDRYELFVGSGFAESLDGSVIRDETWGEGGYYTCLNGPNWRNWFTSELLKQAEVQFGICQDNIACAPWLKGYGCFCESCHDGFREHLRDRYTSEELARIGVSDLDGFSARDYFVQHGRWGFGAVEDVLVREYIKFQHISQLEAWISVVRAVKDVGRSQGRAIPVYGNQIGAFGMWPFAVIISQFTDIVEIEEVIGIGDDIPFQSMYYKLGSASGDHEKPVWIRGPVHDNAKERTPMLSTAFWAIHFSEALANGGFRDFSLGMNAPWTGDPDTLDFMDDPDLYALYKLYAGFIDDNRALFTHRESMARVGLVYSIPTVMFRRYYPLDLDDDTAFVRVQRAADLLDANQIPYDALVFGHSEIFDDTRTLDRLSRYDVIMLPSIDAISDTQVDALNQFVANGGQIIVLDPRAGTRDENFNPRSTPALADIPSIHMSSDRDAAMAALKSASLVSVDAPETVTANVWRSVDGRSLDVHLLNYDVEVQENKVNAVSELQVSVTVPDDLSFDKALLTRPGMPRVTLAFEESDGVVSFTVPTLDDYAVISLTYEQVLNTANAEIKERRAQDREHVKEMAERLDLY